MLHVNNYNHFEYIKDIKAIPRELIAGYCFYISVIRLGLEPRAHTLKVYCSTN